MAAMYYIVTMHNIKPSKISGDSFISISNGAIKTTTAIGTKCLPCNKKSVYGYTSKTNGKRSKSMRLDVGLIKAIEDEAAKNNRSFSNHVETILYKHIE